MLGRVVHTYISLPSRHTTEQKESMATIHTDPILSSESDSNLDTDFEEEKTANLQTRKYSSENPQF